MRVRSYKTLLCFLCVGMAAVPAMIAGAESGASSVLSRAQSVDDPELGELILVAIENHPQVEDREILERICKVTQCYAQIKLLDQQIEQIERRVRSIGRSSEMQYELVLAGAELESKRTAELASLRELMGIIPRHAFGQRKVSELATFVDLDVIGERVYVLERAERFMGEDLRDRFKPAGIMSAKEALDYIRNRFAEKGRLPIRIDIHRTVDGIKLSEELHDAVIELARQSKVQMEAEVHLGPVRQGLGEFVLTLVSDDAPSIDSVYLVDGRPTISLVDGRAAAPQEVDPNRVGEFVAQWLAKPDYLPTRFRIVYPAPMQGLAERTTQAVQEAANRLGVAGFVEVAPGVVEPNAGAAYLGRWLATGKSEILGLDIQFTNQCQFSMSEGLDSSGATTKVPGRWSLAGRQIRVSRSSCTYQGYINADGDLLLCRRRTSPRGNLAAGVAEEPIIFRKLE